MPHVPMPTDHWIPDLASGIQIAETGATWCRVYGGPFDGLWTADDGPTVPTSRSDMRTTKQLESSGAVVVTAWDEFGAAIEETPNP